MTVTHPYYRHTLGDPFGSTLDSVLQGPVVPQVSGMEFLKMFAIAAAGVWLLSKIGTAVRGR